MMESILQDIRQGARLLVKRPGFSVIAVLTLALGIGANTAIFSVVNAILFRPLPFVEPDRLVWFWERQPQLETAPFAAADFLDLQSQNQTFEDVAAVRWMNFNLTGREQPELVPGAITSVNFLSMMKLQPLSGRLFMPEDGQAGAPRVAILNHNSWQNRFGGDPDILGKSITLNGEAVTVVGILPPDFKFNNRTELWVNPRRIVPEPFPDYRGDHLTNRGMHYLRVVGRLRPGVSLTQAQSEIDTIVARLQEQFPNSNGNHSVRLISLHEQITGDVRPALLVLLGAVGLVLMIACANVANLMLARATARYREIAIRTALGAGRRRVIRQLMTESLLLAVVSGALSILIAWLGVKLLVAVSPADTPRLDAVGIDGQVLMFTLAISIVTGLVFGLVPALQASKPDLNTVLKEGGRSGGAGATRNRARSLLVVSEVALSLVLLAGAGLLVKSFTRLLDVRPGFNPDNLLTFELSPSGDKYQEAPARVIFFQQVLDRLKALPGVESVALANDLPITGTDTTSNPRLEGREPFPPDQELLVGQHAVSHDYFEAMGIPVLSGRGFTERDVEGATRVIVVNETAARTLWPGEDPLGKRIRFGTTGPWDEVVGVVADVKHNGLDAKPSMESYSPYAQNPWGYSAIAVRAKGEPAALTSAVRREVQAVDKDQPIYNVRVMDKVLSESVAPRRLSMVLFGLFAGVALILSMVGIYGVMSYAVTQRTHEIGIRMALGAQTEDVLKLVVRQGMWLALIGIAIGLVAALALSRVMDSLLYEVSATDPATFVAISLLLLGVALAANFVPARRASRVDPMIALRYE